MPGIVAFRRRWAVGSDDLVVPGVFLLILHTTWLIVLAVLYGVARSHKDTEEAACWDELWQHVVGYLVLLSVCVVVELVVVYVAMRGTIYDDSPRASMPYLLYVRLVVLVAELVWLVLGIVWLSNHYESCTSKTAKDAILGIVVCNGCVIMSVMITMCCTFDAAGRSWVKMHHDHHSTAGHRRKVLSTYESIWDLRCRLLCCCVSKNDEARNSFTEVARLLSDYFRDLDVVPSDVVAGLGLLRKYQKLKRQDIVESSDNDVSQFLSGVPITPRTRFVQLSTVEGKEEFDKIIHYMRFAMAMYGWPVYLVSSSAAQVCGLCPLLSCWRCCSSSPNTAEVVEDNCCGCHVAAFTRMVPSEGLELLYITYHDEVGQTPFFVALDHPRRAVVVSIRGTLSMEDIITDLTAEGEPLPLGTVKEDWLGHKGMVCAAQYIRRKLHDENILNRAFGHDPSRGTQSYDLVLAGHSLGAGTAAILAIILKPDYPNLSCFAYSPPGGLLSMPAVEYTRGFIVSVVVGKDVIPRLGLHQMETMRNDVINTIKYSRDPKWKTIASSALCCGGSNMTSGVAEDFRAAMREQAAHVHPADASIELTVHQPFYPPGRILHVVRQHPTKPGCLCSPKPVYQAVWVDNQDLGELLVSPCMVQDHMPDKVLEALEKVLESPEPFPSDPATDEAELRHLL